MWMLKKVFSVTLVVLSIPLWWNLCQALEVFWSSVSEQCILYAVCVLCGGCAMD